MPSAAPGSVTAHLKIRVGDRPLEADVTVPRGAVSPVKLLPALQALSDAVVDRAVRDSGRGGLAISCRKGCGACCRQLVPVSEVETHHVAALLDSTPEPRRSLLVERFGEAGARLREAGLLESLRDPDGMSAPDRLELGQAYFRLGIPCPFLEDESCSIHRDRPLACREYLVTSPAAACARPTAEAVKLVPMPVKVSVALFRSGREGVSAKSRWVPLILAPEWADSHVQPGMRPAPQILEEILKNLAATAARP